MREPESDVRGVTTKIGVRPGVVPPCHRQSWRSVYWTESCLKTPVSINLFDSNRQNGLR